MRWSIRYQLLLPPLILLAGVVAMSIWAALAAADQAHRQIDKQVADILTTANRATYELTDNVLKLIKGYSGVELHRTEGERFWTSLPAAPAELPAPAASGQPVPLAQGPRVAVGGTRYLCTSMRLESRPNAGSTLYVFYPESLWRDALWEAVWPPLVLGGFAAAASLVLTVVMGQRLGQRIRHLERRTRQIARGDFSPMPLPSGDDELCDLARSVNDMAQQLSQYQESAQKSERLRLLGQVSGGLAHQLRNSVAGARLAVQVHARECNGHADAEPLDVALRQLALAEVHLKRFLDLGRKEAMKREPCSLAALVNEAVGLLGAQCRHARIELRWQPDPTEDTIVLGDAGQLGHLLVNVLANAIDAAGPGGAVEIALAGGADRAVVEIWDSGPGPAPAIAGRLFEPFVTGRAEGVGLGLAIARQVAEAHGGTITWRREHQRTCFRIELPRAAPACSIESAPRSNQ